MVKSFCGSTACRFVFFLYFCGMIVCNKEHPFQQGAFRRLHRPTVWALLFCFLAFTSCSQRSHHEETFGRVNRLKYVRPDSALALLDSMKAGGQRLSHHDEMLWQLQRIDVENKLDTLFHSTAEAQHLADYFDRHGSANEQVLAHYLLGRAYADTHEAPMALCSFLDAMEKADTTREDCDFKLLSRVCIQAGEVYHHQDLLQEWQDCIHQATHYELLTGDTLAAMRNYAYKSAVLDKMGKSDSALFVTEQVISFLSSHGQYEEAAAWEGYCARKLVRKGQLPKAREYLDAYRSKSGYFNEQGDIKKGKEVFYGVEGEYYLACGRMDSAEYFFRKELSTGKDANNQNIGSKGLAMVFQHTSRLDSALKYAVYAYEMNDSYNSGMNARSIKQIQSMYDYRKSQEKAQNEERKVKARNTWILILAVLVAMLLASLYAYLKNMRVKRQESLQEYEKALAQLDDTYKEVGLLKSHEQEYHDLIEGKEAEINRLNSQIIDYRKKIGEQLKMEEVNLKESPVFVHLNVLANAGKAPTTKDWEDIGGMLAKELPAFSRFLMEKDHLLNTKDKQICILLRLHIKPYTIGNMLGVSAPYITKQRKQMLQTLFGIDGKASDFDNRILEYC